MKIWKIFNLIFNYIFLFFIFISKISYLKNLIYEFLINNYYNKSYFINYDMLTLFKSVLKSKDNWPKISLNRNFFLKYFSEEQSKFLKNIEIAGTRVGHPEFLTYVDINNENYLCIRNISHQRIVVRPDSKFFEGKLVGYDKKNKPLYFIIEDLGIKKVDFNNLGDIIYDLVNNICKSDYPIYLKDNYEMQMNILFSIDVYLKNKGYENYFVYHKILDITSFADQTNVIIEGLKNDLLKIHDKTD